MASAFTSGVNVTSHPPTGEEDAVVVPVIISTKRKVACRAIVDTGMSIPILLPKSVARSAGVRLGRPGSLPRATDGREIPGRVGVVSVRIPKAKIFLVTYAFCPDAGVKRVLIGARFLCDVGARLMIGSVAYPFPPSLKRCQGYLWAKGLDLSDWILPTHRPVTPWW
jgi:hypothetical protein